MVRLTVIVPVYGVESTLDRCVESILCQKVDDMEVILVDDGSNDRCPSMCDDWAQRDCRIRVIHKPNGWQSDARNAGLDMAQGSFITFVDSDDTLNPNVYPLMLGFLNMHQQVDFIEYSINCIGWEKRDVAYPDAIYSSARLYWYKTRSWNHAYVWNKIYRRSLFNNVRFSIGNLFEDVLIQPDILRQCRMVATSSFIGYNYFAANSTVCAAIDANTIKQCLLANLQVQKAMCVRWYSVCEWNFFMCMLYRQVDVYRLSGEIILKWPFVRLICWLHKHVYSFVSNRS